MFPLLREFKRQECLRNKEACDFAIEHFGLTQEEAKELLPSKTQTRIANRVSWSIKHLKMAGLLRRVERGLHEVTEAANEVLGDPKAKKEGINIKYLQRFPSFVEFQNISQKKKTDTNEDDTINEDDPSESLEKSYERTKDGVLGDLLIKVRDMDFKDFEKLCLVLMRKMGYGRQWEHTGQTGDHGRDGQVLMDRLGLDTILLQAKRFKEGSPVPERDIRDFIGTLNIHKSKKGVFITSSNFSSSCRQIVESIESNIALIDGKELVELLFEYNIGLETKGTYDIKEIDEDYFENII